MPKHSLIKWLNLSLLLFFPLAWAAPLLRTGLFSIFEGEDISILSGIAALWENDKPLALIVAFFALIAPMAKTIGLAALHWGRLSERARPALSLLAKLAMADIFLVALSIIVVKGTGIGYIELRWGFWLFAACVLLSLGLSLAKPRR